MMSKYSIYTKQTKLLIVLLCVILNSFASSVLATTINGRIVVLSSHNSKFSVLLQINTDTGTDDLGGATMVLKFDTTAIWFTNKPIKNVDYVFHNFSGGNYYDATLTKPQRNRIWVNIDLPYFNNNNGVVVAGSPEWTDVVTIHFDVINQNQTPGLSWFLSSFFWGIYDADNMTQWDNGIFDGNFGLAVNIVDGWNMVSVPGINPNGQGVNTWWQGRDPVASVYKLQGGYVPVMSTTPGEGYFLKHTGNRTYNTGDEWPGVGIQIVPNNPITASAGWNLIGGYENQLSVTNLTTTPPGLISGQVYTFAGTYKIATHIEPGRGYLIYLTNAGQINFPGVLVKDNSHNAEHCKDQWGKLTFTDNSLKQFSLYLVNDNTDLNYYALPPVPPDGMFDVRFRSDRMAENITGGTQIILMRGIEYPVKVKVDNMNISLNDEFGKIINTYLKAGEEISITEESVDKIFIISGNSLTTQEYFLEQNYPNPFNQNTIIRWQTPVSGRQIIKVFDVLGKEVATLVDQYYETGKHEVTFNAKDLASGVYIYKIQSGSYTESKKLLLMK